MKKLLLASLFSVLAMSSLLAVEIGGALTTAKSCLESAKYEAEKKGETESKKRIEAALAALG